MTLALTVGDKSHSVTVPRHRNLRVGTLNEIVGSRRRGNAGEVDTDPVHTYPVPMNVTLSIDDRVVAEARRIAAVRGTSLNQLVRNYLNELTRTDDAEAVIARLNALWTEEDYRSQGPWTREELHERS